MESSPYLVLLALLPFGALVGFISWNVLKRGVKEVIKESDPLRLPGDNSAESILARDRAETRALYERIVREKLDVMKTAIAMGMDQQELNNLDSRLETLIGAEKLQELLTVDGATPRVHHELLDADLSAELRRIKEEQQASGGTN